MPHTWVVVVQSNVLAFGSNVSCQCELPTAALLRGRKATQVCGGYAHSLMLLEDGQVLPFGCNKTGQCVLPAAQLKGRRTTQVAAGAAHSLLLLEDGTVLAFGSNRYGQCNVPIAGLMGKRITQVAAGAYHALLLTDSGSVLTFGYNSMGQCDVPTLQLRGRKVIQVAAGGAHSLLLLDDGNVLAFGLNHHGQVNIPTTAVLQGRRVTQVAAGGHHSCMLLDDGSVLCFGWNEHGQCTTPTAWQLRGLKATQVSASGATSFAILDDGSLWFWGRNENRKTTAPTEIPLPGSIATQIEAGAYHFLILVEAEHEKKQLSRCRHSAGVDEVVYKEIQDFVATVTPRKRVSEHFREEVPKAFPEIRPEFIEYYCNAASVLATSRIQAGVTKDLEPMEVWAMVIYTMDSRNSGLNGSGASQNFYYQLNKCLQKRDLGVIRHIKNYLHFLMRGLNQLDCIQPDLAEEARCVYRGVSRTALEVIRTKYKAGLHIHWSGITSVSLEKAVARDFACEDGHGGVIFEIWSWTARVLGDISAVPAEKEAVLLPNFRAIVLEGLTQNAGDEFWLIKLREKQKSEVYVF